MDQDNCEIEKTIAALENVIVQRKRHLQEMQQNSPGGSLTIQHLFSEIFSRAEGSLGQMANALEQGSQFVRSFISTADEHLRERPWHALRIVAVYSFGVGMFLSLRHRKPRPKEK